MGHVLASFEILFRCAMGLTLSARRGGKLAKDQDLFTGQVWTGPQALKLGLIDGLGGYRQILPKLFGEDIEIKEIKKVTFGMKDLLLFPSTFASAFAESLVSTLENRFLKSKFKI